MGRRSAARWRQGLVALALAGSLGFACESKTANPGGEPAPPMSAATTAVTVSSSVATVAPASSAAVTPAGMVRVAAGEFEMGCGVGRWDSDCSTHERPIHRVFLDAFHIDATDVTLAQYRRCVDAGACTSEDLTKPLDVGGPEVDCNWGRPNRDAHPINCVSWHQAAAFCRWQDKALPTEAQWEKAARGADGRMYPWGNQDPDEDERLAVRLAFWPRPTPPNSPDHVNSTWPVGSKPAEASPYGALDMAGNVWEWTADWYARDYYTRSPERNPPGPAAGASRVIRGDVIPWLLRSTQRSKLAPAARMSVLGFRCARADR